jgi:desulfoferrodoxin (superoxide reductase-like protein)
MTPTLNRRDFLKQSGVLASLAFLPSLVGCGTGSDDEVSINSTWESRATELEAKADIRTANKPGPWGEKVAGHLPAVDVEHTSKQLTVATAHGMSEEHYITTLYVRNQDGIVIGLKEFSPTDAEPKAVFSYPKGTTKITVYSHCNKHDNWMIEMFVR